MKTPYNKVFYIAFILIGIYYFVASKNYEEIASTLGIGLIFDPFNPEQKWNDRPFWQKAVLIIHLALVAVMFGLGIGLNNK